MATDITVHVPGIVASPKMGLPQAMRGACSCGWESDSPMAEPHASTNARAHALAKNNPLLDELTRGDRLMIPVIGEANYVGGDITFPSSGQKMNFDELTALFDALTNARRCTCKESSRDGYSEADGIHHEFDTPCWYDEGTVGKILRVCIDADCPSCGHPERWWDDHTKTFGCNNCPYQSKEREA